MVTANLLECSFFIPLKRGANLSDGLPHETSAWEKLVNELYVRFQGGTVAPGHYSGFYQDSDTGARVDDESVRYIVALSEEQLDSLRDLLREACEWFQQKCIYVSIAGRVEFVGSKQGESS